ncbi:MAG TPA: type IV pilus assembly protein PilM [Candidatus Dormibacteraeota bacterium]|nr:type IV pilus assembly protein PilM [Candidatus Dormibacteraeota bacterium]
MELTAKKSKPVVGLEIAGDSIAAAEVKGQSGELGKVAVAQLPDGAFRDGEVTDPEALADTLRTLFSTHKLSRRVRLGIANQRVVVRALRLPAIDDPAEQEAAVRFQAQEQIPMPLDQAVLDYRVVGGAPATEDSSPTIDVILVAARREMVEATLAPLRKAGLQPVGIDLSAFGLIRALGEAGPIASEPAEEGAAVTGPEGAALYCNLGDTTNLAVSRRRSCLFTRVAPVGLGDFAEQLAAQTGLSPEHARMWLGHVGLSQPLAEISGDASTVAAAREVLSSGVDSLQAELRLSLDFYAAQEGAAPVDKVILSGQGIMIPGFAEALQVGFHIPFESRVPEALRGFDGPTATRLTLSYGLALES